MTTATQKEKAILNEIVITAGVSTVNAQNILEVLRKQWVENPVGLISLLHPFPVVAKGRSKTTRVTVKRNVRNKNTKKVATIKTTATTKTKVKKSKKNKKNKKAKGVSLKKNTNTNA